MTVVRGCIPFFKWEGMVVGPEILGLVFYASGFVVTLTSICLPYCQPPLYFSHPYRFVATPKPRYFYSRELLWHSARELLSFLLPLIDFNKINSILGDTRFSKRTKSKVSEMTTRGEIRSPSCSLYVYEELLNWPRSKHEGLGSILGSLYKSSELEKALDLDIETMMT